MQYPIHAQGKFEIYPQLYPSNKIYYGKAIKLYTANQYISSNTHYKITSSTQLNPSETYILRGILYNPASFISEECKHIPSILNIKKKIRLKLKAHIEKKIVNTTSSQFLTSLFLGYPLQGYLKEYFKELGISHLFVVSGLHFSFFSTIFVYMLAPINKLKIKLLLLAGLSSIMLILLPFTPSVFRSWVTFLITILSLSQKGSCSSLNSLGISFVIGSLLFPIASLTFIFSYLATLGILLFFKPIQNFLLQPWLSLLDYSPYHYLAIYFIRFIANSLAITLSAHMFLIPIILYYFEELTLNSFLYNLFFPFLVFISLCLLLLALITNLPILFSLTNFLIKILTSRYLTCRVLGHMKCVFYKLSYNKTLLILFLVLYLGILIQKIHKNHYNSDGYCE